MAGAPTEPAVAGTQARPALPGPRDGAAVAGSGEAGDVHQTGGAIDRAFELLGWEPRITLREGLAAQVAWSRAILQFHVTGRRSSGRAITCVRDPETRIRSRFPPTRTRAPLNLATRWATFDWSNATRQASGLVRRIRQIQSATSQGLRYALLNLAFGMTIMRCGSMTPQ